jgi:hypothetical protein
MSLEKFKFSEFDVNFVPTSKDGIYLINSNNDFINNYISLQIAFENVINKKKVLFFTDNEFCTLKNYAMNIDLDFERIMQSEDFLLLQYPKNMYDLFKEPHVVTAFLRDIDNYIEDFVPMIVIFDRVNKFYTNSDVKIDSFKNRFLTTIKKNNVVNYLISSVGDKFNVAKISNHIEATFNIEYFRNETNNNFITYSASNKKQIKLRIALSNRGIIVDPKIMSFKKIGLKKISIILYPKFLVNFEHDFKSIFREQVLCKSFVNCDDIDYHKYSDSYLAIILPDWIGNPSVFEFAKKIIREYPKVTLYLLVSKLTAYHHKARAKRIGFKGFLEMPAGIEEIKNIFQRKNNSNNINQNDNIESYNIIYDEYNIFDNDNYFTDELIDVLYQYSKKKIFKEESFVLLSIKSRVKFDERDIENHINFNGLNILAGKSTKYGYHYLIIINANNREVIKLYKNTILKKISQNLNIDDNFTNFENNVIIDYIPQNKKIIAFESFFYPFDNPNFKNILKKISL